MTKFQVNLFCLIVFVCLMILPVCKSLEETNSSNQTFLLNQNNSLINSTSINSTLNSFVPPIKPFMLIKNDSLLTNQTSNINQTTPQSGGRSFRDSLIWFALILFSFLSQLRRNDWQGLNQILQTHSSLAIGLPFVSGIFCGISLILLLHLLRFCYRQLFFQHYYIRKSALLKRKNNPSIRESHLLLRNNQEEDDEESEYEI